MVDLVMLRSFSVGILVSSRLLYLFVAVALQLLEENA